MLTDQKVYHQAGSVNSTGNGQDFGKRAPLFVDYIFDQLVRDYGIENPERAGLRVYTTLDYSITEYAEKQLKYYILEPHDIKWSHYCKVCTNVPPLAQTANAHNGAMVAIDPHNGDIISFVGSVDYGNPDKRIAGYIDMTGATGDEKTRVSRSMGSSVKGVIYTTAFQMGWNPAMMLQDQPICFDWQIRRSTIPANHKQPSTTTTRPAAMAAMSRTTSRTLASPATFRSALRSAVHSTFPRPRR